MKFPFGKFKGTDVKYIETSYLIWALENFDLKEPLYSAVKSEAASRINFKPTERPIDNIKVAYLAMAKKYHPDKGGSNQAMQAINEFYQLLCKK